MNEPSVFDSATKTVPSDALHTTSNNVKVQHRDLHNAYGALQQKSSYQALLERDEGKYRPFVLTRSFFIGSQKFGAYWTGDNRSINQEVRGSVVQVL